MDWVIEQSEWIEQTVWECNIGNDIGKIEVRINGWVVDWIITWIVEIEWIESSIVDRWIKSIENVGFRIIEGIDSIDGVEIWRIDERV